MSLKLHKPICFFDLETTGINVGKDRIVEISVLKVFPNGNKESKTLRVNPEIPISAEATSVHGITNEDVANEPTFKEIAPQIWEMMKDSDIGGYNSNRFDVPLLAEEFLRNDFDFDMDKHRFVDVQVIFFKKEPRDLSSAFKFYCDKTLENAHSAAADVEATYEIFKAQIERYDDLENDIKFLSEYTNQRKTADLAGMIGINDKGQEIFNFGKYKGQVVREVLEKDQGYYGWIQNADFPMYTKKVLTKIKLKSSDLFNS
ncbi:3'-5' exonuclease [Moheibacter lacus]|uniref:3'-5' exonuclease n=1 Tax=Moheibacter lacus TaxID=2745851 RepID=A0A838ZKF4_9FLAO|nr:3'-5' exonuclease [Moheibacter lacus]MBA5629728.1 3'-5' exonuclease [Moheibacter lacus]